MSYKRIGYIVTGVSSYPSNIKLWLHYKPNKFGAIWLPYKIKHPDDYLYDTISNLETIISSAEDSYGVSENTIKIEQITTQYEANIVERKDITELVCQ